MFIIAVLVIHFVHLSYQDSVTYVVNSTSSLFEHMHHQSGHSNVTSLPIDLLLLIHSPGIDFNQVDGITQDQYTLQRPDVASVTIQCSSDVEWRCGGGYCLVIHPDTKNVTILGCQMYGGIQATDPYPENSTMSLSIR
eukprot:PhF_6_TR1968/c4_g5_i1/m.3252